ncbi:hypothetical protein [Synoicihabitans lomoniglobus]|uniref:PEP-CTERM sorting domain-containing protein n=1 Tax=Synoicihabitans lomoniglobus TaxID=2909285 RepID=A0AAF0CNV7_9BACT|nr:hypothetical protein [Opitutaceae bacterium LMO-M01]WED65121.1 hypothetical protein PXH66_22515 [Opitutaceae bacterium LMO-M01]
MPPSFRSLVGALVLTGAASLSAQSIISAHADYDVADGLIEWSFVLDEDLSTATVTHLVLGFDDGSGVPGIFWDDVAHVTVHSSTFHVTKEDVWPDSGAGISYLELNFNSPFTLGGASATHSFNYQTSGTNGLANSANFFVSLYADGPATQNVSLDGSLVATLSGFGTTATDLSAVPESSAAAIWAGLAVVGFAGVRRRRAPRGAAVPRR